MPHSESALAVGERIKAACDRFEAEWRSGGRPKISEFLATAAVTDLEALQQALLALESKLQGRGESELSLTRDGNSPTTTINDDPAHQPSPQTSIGRFEIRGVLGNGAYGKVYRAF